MSTLLLKARLVIKRVKTANAEVINRIQVTTLTKGPRSSLDPGWRGTERCEEEKATAVIASLAQRESLQDGVKRANDARDVYSTSKKDTKRQFRIQNQEPVSYTHLTLPTIYSV